MKRLIVFVLLLFGCADVMAQGSAPAPPQVWRRRGNGDTILVFNHNRSDSLVLLDSALYWIWDATGTNRILKFRDTTIFSNYVRSLSNLRTNFLVIDNGFSVGPDTLNNVASSVFGEGLQVADYGGGIKILEATLGNNVSGSEMVNQTVTKTQIDTTGSVVFGHAYKTSSVDIDNEYTTLGYAVNYLNGWPISNGAADGQYPKFLQSLNGGTGGVQWSTVSSGGTGGDDLSWRNVAGVSGSNTTAWNTGVLVVAPGNGIAFRHPSGGIDSLYIENQDSLWLMAGNRDTMYLHGASSASDKYFSVTNNGTTTELNASGGNNAFYIGKPLTVNGNLVFSSPGFGIYNAVELQGSGTGLRGSYGGLYIDDSTDIFMQANSGLAKGSVYIGGTGTSGYKFRLDTMQILGSDGYINLNNGSVNNARKVKSDTITVGVNIRAGSDVLKILSDNASPDTMLTIQRVTATDSTNVNTRGRLVLQTTDAGLVGIDSTRLEGHTYAESPAGVNQNIDSANHVEADTTISKIYGKFLGSTSGFVGLKAPATAGSQSYTLPTGYPATDTDYCLSSTTVGVMSWKVRGSGSGSGNGSADFDTVNNLDSNVLKGIGGASILSVRHNSNTVTITSGSKTNLSFGSSTPGVPIVDSSLLINKSLWFVTAGDTAVRLDSTIVRSIKRLVLDSIAQSKGRFAVLVPNQNTTNRYYFRASDIYWKPEQYATSGVTASWNWGDSTATFPNNIYKSYLMTYRDTTGASYLPVNFTWDATEADSLFSFVYKAKTSTGSDTTTAGITKAHLYVNESLVGVDSIGNNFSTTSFTTDSMDFTDRTINQGDRVTVLLWLRTSGATNTVTVQSAYLNMRKR